MILLLVNVDNKSCRFGVIEIPADHGAARCDDGHDDTTSPRRTDARTDIR